MSNFEKYNVAFDSNGRHVEIVPYEGAPSIGHRIIGSFEADFVNNEVKGDKDFDRKGDHLMIAKAKSILENLGILDFQNMVYEDKVSNYPTGESYTPTIAEVEKSVREGTDPAEYRTQVSENLDKAEKKFTPKHLKDRKNKNDLKDRE